MRVGLQLPWFDWPGSRDGDLRLAIKDAAQSAEAAGFASLWVMDHFFPIECFAVLNYSAALTETIELGPLVSSTIYRHPSVLIGAAGVGHAILNMPDAYEPGVLATIGRDVIAGLGP